jgi:hypothetical protein
MWRMFGHDQPACATARADADDRLGRGKGDTMEYLGTPFAWSVFAVIAIAVAAAMITYAIRKKDETAPPFGEVSGTLKQDWTRAGKIDFHVAALESTSPQQLILRVGEKRITLPGARYANALFAVIRAIGFPTTFGGSDEALC